VRIFGEISMKSGLFRNISRFRSDFDIKNAPLFQDQNGENQDSFVIWPNIGKFG